MFPALERLPLAQPWPVRAPGLHKALSWGEGPALHMVIHNDEGPSVLTLAHVQALIQGFNSNCGNSQEIC